MPSLAIPFCTARIFHPDFLATAQSLGLPHPEGVAGVAGSLCHGPDGEMEWTDSGLWYDREGRLEESRLNSLTPSALLAWGGTILGVTSRGPFLSALHTLAKHMETLVPRHRSWSQIVILRGGLLVFPEDTLHTIDRLMDEDEIPRDSAISATFAAVCDARLSAHQRLTFLAEAGGFFTRIIAQTAQPTSVSIMPQPYALA